MSELTYPGVYVQELPSGLRPLAAASTSRAVFVGDTETGPSNRRAVFITSWEEYQAHFGGFSPGPGYVAHAVFQYFNNGGRSCYVLRAEGSGGRPASVELQGTDPLHKVLVVRSRTLGVSANSLQISISKSSRGTDDSFRLTVKRQSPAGTAAEELESHDDLSMDPSSPRFVANVLRSESKLVRAEVHAAAPAISDAAIVGSALTGWPTEAGRFILILNRKAFGIAVPAATTATSDESELVTRLNLALEEYGVIVSATAAHALQLSVPASAGGATPTLELVPSPDDPSQSNYAESLGFKPGTPLTVISPYESRRPKNIDDVKLQGGRSEGIVFDGEGRTAHALDEIIDASILVLPGLFSQFSSAIDYCANRPLHDMFVIGDCAAPTPNKLEDIAGVKQLAVDANKSGMGALYYPWVRARDPSGESSVPVELPPSGFLAGIYARTDRDRGVWKAPAGVESILHGAVGLAHDLTDEQQGPLNIDGINVLRKFNTTGIVSWGARALSSDATRRYISVRRLQGMIQRSVSDGLLSAVFQPNNHLLWSSLKADVGAFLDTLFRAGAFQGESPRDAYFVRCGLGETMTQVDIDLGKVIVDIGFAPVKPAEFVLVRVQHTVERA